MMQMLARLCATLCAAAGLIAAPSVASAASYTLFDLGMLGAPGEWHRMTATGLNSSGQVVGYASFFSADAQGQPIEATQAWVTGANGIGLSTIPTLGGTWNRANGINDAGWVVGSSLTANGSERAFAAGPNGASPHDLGTLGGSSSAAAGINASGQVVGTSTTAAGVQRGFISDAQTGSLHDLGSLYAGATATSSATAINDAGQVTGTAIAAHPLDGTERAFVTGPNGSAMRPVTVPTANGDVPNWGTDINASGQTVGTTSAFYYYQTGFIAEADGSGRLLQLPEIPQGGTEPPFFFLDSRATALNSAGQVVGSYRLGTLASGLFVTGPGGAGGNYLDYKDFVGGTLPMLFDEARAINDAGQIIANGSDGHAYLISPVPEPAIVLLMTGGLGLLAWRRRTGGGIAMKSGMIRALAALMFMAGLGAGAPARAAEYNLLDLGQLGSHPNWSVWASGINASGQVVGYAYSKGTFGQSATNDYQAFITGANGVGLQGLGTLGSNWSRAYGINDAGQVVGTSGNADFMPRAFVTAPGGGAMRDLGTFGGVVSSAAGINASGQVVGSMQLADGRQHAFVTGPNGGAVTDLGSFGGPQSGALAVNDSGRVAGGADRLVGSPGYGRETPFVTGPGAAGMTAVSVTGYPSSDIDTNGHVTAINAGGQAAGTIGSFVGDAHAFIADANGIGHALNIREAGEFPLINSWRLDSQALAINASGQVGGSFYYTPYLMDHAFITGPDGSGLVDVNTLSFANATRTDFGFFNVTGINDLGQFIANGTNGHAYLISPVPEPAMLSMLLAGLGWIGWRRLRGRLRTRLVALAAAVLAPAGAWAADYHLFDLGNLGAPAGWEIYATGINNSGQVVGYSYTGYLGTSYSDQYQAWVTGANGTGMQTIPTLGGEWNRAFGINDAGLVVGSSGIASGNGHAFITGPNGASPRDLGTLGAGDSEARAINAAGRVVGSSQLAGGGRHAFITGSNGGAMQDLGTLGGWSSGATAINSAGRVTGSADNVDGVGRAFVTGPNGGAMSEVSVPGYPSGSYPTQSAGSGINAAGQLTGNAWVWEQQPQAFLNGPGGESRLLDPGESGYLPTYDGLWQLTSKSAGINADGQVVGSFLYSPFAIDHAFVTGPDGSGLVDVNKLSFVEALTRDFTFYSATAINDLGQFVVNGTNGHAYLISPVPEPATLVLFAAGLAWLARRRLARALAPLAASAAMLFVAAPAHALDYTLTDLGSLSGWSNFYASGLNNSGQVVGYGYNDGSYGTSRTDSYQAFVTGANGIGMTAIPTLGGSWNRARAINDSGWVTGTSATTTSTPGGDTRAFVLEGTGAAPRSLGTLAGPTSAQGINASGQVVGSYTAPGSTQRGFVTDAGGGALHDVGTLGGPNSWANGINAAGSIVGTAEYRYPDQPTDPSRTRGFVSHDGGQTRTQVAVTGYDQNSLDTYSSANAINDRGQVVGTVADFYGPSGRAYITDTNGIGRVLNLGDIADFYVVGSRYLTSQASAINNLGQVAGSYFYSTYMVSHAFISGADGYGLLDINSLSFNNLSGPRDWTFFSATGINDLGQFITNASNGHAYLVTPVPEPAALLMMACGLGWLLWRRGVRRS